jgi:protein subunit release factor A
MSINLKILVHVLTVNFLVHLCRCDRILSSDKGMRLLSYNTVDNRLSDHRPVTAVYMVDVEVFSSKKLQRALTFTDAEVEDHLSFEEDSASGVYILGLN